MRDRSDTRSDARRSAADRAGRAHLTRRDFARGLVAAAAAGPLALVAVARRAVAEQSDEVLVTEIESNRVIIESLAYANESPKPEQICAGCVLYQGPAEGRGKCGLFQKGVVSSQGWCRSWAARP